MGGSNQPSARRGVSVIEAVIALALGAFVFLGATMLACAGARQWHNTQARAEGRNNLEVAAARIAAEAREALRIDADRSGLDYLTVVMPRAGADGEYLLPLADGIVITYYLSNESGAFTARGDVLWRMVDGRPDADWALRGEAPVVRLSDGGLQIVTSAENPHEVRLILHAASASGQFAAQQELQTAITLRNAALVHARSLQERPPPALD